jgi:hypothetical protein
MLEFENDFYLRQMRAPRNQEAFVTLVREIAEFPWRIRMVSSRSGAPRVETTRRAEPASGERKLPAGETQDSTPNPAGTGGVAQSPIVKKSLDIFRGRLV